MSKSNRAHVIQLSNDESICDAMVRVRQPADFVFIIFIDEFHRRTAYGKLIVFHFISLNGIASFINAYEIIYYV